MFTGLVWLNVGGIDVDQLFFRFGYLHPIQRYLQSDFEVVQN